MSTYRGARPNRALELTLLGGKQDRRDFDSRFLLEGFPDLLGGAAQRQAVRRLLEPLLRSLVFGLVHHTLEHSQA
jgi:hypothetical protein